jgi:hypothetical protein
MGRRSRNRTIILLAILGGFLYLHKERQVRPA